MIHRLNGSVDDSTFLSQRNAIFVSDVVERTGQDMSGWSQEALANEAGLDRTYISGIERS